jgi:hypothetical protein
MGKGRLYVTLPRSLEEESYNENLQPRHCDHQSALHQTEIEDPLLSTPDRAKVPVLSCAEVLLISAYRGQLCGKLDNGLFKNGSLLGRGTLLGGELGTIFILDLE